MDKHRKRFFLALLATLALLALLAFGPTAAAQARGPQSVADLAEGLSESVVNISTSKTVAGGPTIPFPNFPPGSPFRDFFEEFLKRQQQQGARPRRVRSLGSGFVIDESGIIVTNNHVIADATEGNGGEIVVKLYDGTTLNAEVAGRDPKTDIALLKIKPEKALKAVRFGDSDALRVGDWVMAIGNPFGLGGSVTVGIVSARNRDIQAGPYDDFIQTDAAINRGNSGGPLFNMDGEVVGINTAILSPSGGSVGIGFAIPASTAIPVIRQLREYGETRRGWLGVRIQTITDEIAESLGLERTHGALVADVIEGSPSETAGIKTGDVIIGFDGQDVPEMRDLPRMVADTPIGKTVDVVVVRKGKEITLKVEIGRLEEGEKKMAEQAGEPEASGAENSLGLTLAPLDDELRQRFNIDEKVSGVVVTEVDAGSVAAEKRISAGDVITEVDQERVSTPQDVTRRIEKLKKAGRKTVLLLLSSNTGEPRFAALRLDEASTDDEEE